MNQYQELSEKVKEGVLNPLRVYIDLMKQQKQIAEALDEVKGLAINEALNYPEKTFKMSGAIVEKRSTPSTWDYSNVQQYQEAKQRLAYIQKLAQIGGMDESGNEVPKAVKIEGKQTIAISFQEDEQ